MTLDQLFPCAELVEVNFQTCFNICCNQSGYDLHNVPNDIILWSLKDTLTFQHLGFQVYDMFLEIDWTI